MTQLPYGRPARFPITVVLRNLNQKRKSRLLVRRVARCRNYSLPDFNVFYSFIKALDDRHRAPVVTLPDCVCRLTSNLFVFRFIANEAGQASLFASDLTKPVNRRRSNSRIGGIGNKRLQHSSYTQVIVQRNPQNGSFAHLVERSGSS